MSGINTMSARMEMMDIVFGLVRCVRKAIPGSEVSTFAFYA